MTTSQDITLHLQKLDPHQLRDFAHQALQLAEKKEKAQKTAEYHERYYSISRRVRLDAIDLIRYEPQDEVMHGIDGNWYRSTQEKLHLQALQRVRYTEDLYPFIRVLHKEVIDGVAVFVEIGTMEGFETEELTEKEIAKLVEGSESLEAWLEKRITDLHERLKDCEIEI